MRFILTGGNISDAKLAIPLLTGLDARHVLADKAYDSHAILNHVEASGARPIIPQRTCMPRQRNFDPRHLQAAQPHRTHHRQAQAATPRRYPLRPIAPQLSRYPIPRRHRVLVLNVDST